MKILVTGSSGWIGGKFCDLSKEDYEILKYDLPKKDILDVKNLEMYISECDIVVHFAAIADLYESIDNQDKNFDVNIKGTYNIAKLCAQYNKKLVFISTCCVYGNTGDMIETEDYSVPAVIEPYACSKMAGEYILRGTPDLQYKILRIGTAYGPGQRSALFTAVVFDKIIEKKTIEIHGDGKQTRQLIYIEDLVNGIKKAVDRFDIIHNREIINLCGNDHISAIDTLRTACNVTKESTEVKYVNQRYGQTFKENCSIEKAKRLLEWFPETSFSVGMTKTYNMEYKNG